MNMTKILAIDDKPDNLTALSALLRNLIPDCIVIKALSGPQGIKIAKTEEIDTILLDIQMPVIDGFETCKILRKDNETCHIPIIMLTAINTDPKSRVKGLEHGADAFLSKPFDKSELVAQVQTMLRIRKNEKLLRLNNELLEERVNNKTKELLAAKKRYQDLYENAPDMFLSIEPESGRIVQFNNAWEKTIGYSKENIKGRPIFDFCHQDSLNEATEIFNLCFKTGHITDAELKLQKKTGETIDVCLNLSSVRDENGRILYYQSVFHDITIRNEMKKETKRLIKFVDSKNIELQNIIYAASHDLRSPLVNIEGFSGILKNYLKELLELLQSDSIPENTRKLTHSLIHESIPKAMSYIQSGTAKMNALLDGLLQISRVGTHKLELRTIDINKVVATSIKTMTFQVKIKGIKFTTDDLPECMGDLSLISQIFSNLIDNAIKYKSKDRQAFIKVSGTKEKNKCIYVVEDNGIGIAKKNQGKIFNLFYRLNPTEPDSGEGIGLSLIKRILDLHHGTIILESEPGKGTKFIFTLPARRELSAIT